MLKREKTRVTGTVVLKLFSLLLSIIKAEYMYSAFQGSHNYITIAYAN